MGGKNSYESIKRYEDKAYDKVLVRFPRVRKILSKPTQKPTARA